MVLYISNNLSSSIRKDIHLLFSSSNLLTYLLTLDNIKTNGLITLSKYLIKYLELNFVSINFEITILSTLTSQILFNTIGSKLVSSHQNLINDFMYFKLIISKD